MATPKHEPGAGELRLIHWPKDDSALWLVEVNPRDGSFFPLAELKTKTLPRALSRLSATADLLAACKLARDSLESWFRAEGSKPENDVEWCQLDAAIAKAEP